MHDATARKLSCEIFHLDHVEFEVEEMVNINVGDSKTRNTE